MKWIARMQSKIISSKHCAISGDIDEMLALLEKEMAEVDEVAIFFLFCF